VERVALPRPGSINTGLSPARVQTMVSVFGWPRSRFGTHCEPITRRNLKALMETRRVGSFRVTGLRFALDSLEAVMREIERQRPDVFRALGSGGMLCCRLVRGSQTQPSNHSWGTAIDLTVCGKLDTRGDGKVFRGLLEAYPFFHRHGWYWGAGFRVEDAMHFELAEETIQRLAPRVRAALAD
jgi:hypothetical protein